MKKLMIWFLSLFMAMGLLTGCKKNTEEEEPVNLNEARAGNYKYDFAEFLDLKLYGYEGHGFIEIKPLDFSVENFDSEEDYIAIKRVVESLKLYHIPGSNQSSGMTVTPSEDLKNGDIVVIGLKEGTTIPEDVSMNILPFQVEIGGLTAPKELNLFDPINVQFWGLDGTNEVYAEKQETDNLPAEVKEHLVYNINMDTDTVQEGKSILNIHADLDSSFLNNPENPYYTSDIYFGKMAYEAERDSEMVLRNVAYPMNLDEEDQKQLGVTLLTEIKKTDAGKSINNVASIQQNENPSDPYSYLITLDTKDDKCMKADVRVAKIFGKYKVLSMSTISTWVSAKGSSCTDSYNGQKVLVRYIKNSTQTPVGSVTKAESTLEPSAEPSTTPTAETASEPTADPTASPETTSETVQDVVVE